MKIGEMVIGIVTEELKLVYTFGPICEDMRFPLRQQCDAIGRPIIN